MFTDSSIPIRAEIDRVFEVTSHLENWVPMLPHYRYIHFAERSPDGLVNRVKMACWRGPVPISWHSIHEIKPELHEVHFTHLKAFTKGMLVVWTYTESDGGVEVRITHDLRFRLRFLAPILEPLICRGFVEPVARRTLSTFKSILEAERSHPPSDQNSNLTSASKA